LNETKCVASTPSIPIVNSPADYSAVLCNTLPVNTCLKCSKDNRYCLACKGKVTNALCDGATLGLNVIFATVT
jgi:hypothetical protein